uniref:Baculoviral IAP repeat-containing 2 n=1 Tax=Mus musculus TaxID=10090 RepID=F6X8Q0_MOUSE
QGLLGRLRINNQAPLLPGRRGPDSVVSAAAFVRTGERGSRRLGGLADSSFGPEGSSQGRPTPAPCLSPWAWTCITVLLSFPFGLFFQSTQASLEFAAILLPPIVLGAGITGVQHLGCLFRFSAGF